MRLTKHQLRVLEEMAKLDTEFGHYGINGGFRINGIKANYETVSYLASKELIGQYKCRYQINREWVILRAGKQELLKRGRK